MKEKTSGDSLWDCSHQKYQNMIWVCQKMVKLPSSRGEVDGGNDFLNHVILVFSVSLNFQTNPVKSRSKGYWRHAEYVVYGSIAWFSMVNMMHFIWPCNLIDVLYNYRIL